MHEPDINHFIRTLKRFLKKFKEPAVTQVARKRDPFKVLISCIISLRTKDQVTHAASRKLFAAAETPEEMLELPKRKIERLIFPAGFYKTKAGTIREISRTLLADHGGQVPDDLDELLKLKGVGRKTANLVITMGFNKPGICVDVHVHRISNRWGYIRTKSPDESEMALRKKLPRRHWIGYNDLLVTFGQNVCTPVSPKCSLCPLEQQCPRTGVERQR